MPFAGPGRGLSSGPTEDDVDLSVLHALGRSGYFSWDVVPSLILRLRACGGGSVGGEGGGPLCLWWTEGQTYLSRPSGLVLPHQQGPWPGPTGQYIPFAPTLPTALIPSRVQKL